MNEVASVYHQPPPHPLHSNLEDQSCADPSTDMVGGPHVERVDFNQAQNFFAEEAKIEERPHFVEEATEVHAQSSNLKIEDSDTAKHVVY